MKKFFCTAVVASCFGAAHGQEGIVFLKERFETVSITSSNISVKFKSPGGGYSVSFYCNPPEWDHPPPEHRWATEYIENNEPLVLTPDKKVILNDGGHGATVFEPVAFISKHKGFRITDTNDRKWGDGRTSNVVYVALSNTPVQVGEKDVAEVLWIPRRGLGAYHVQGHFHWMGSVVTSTNLVFYFKADDVSITQQEKTFRPRSYSSDFLFLTPKQAYVQRRSSGRDPVDVFTLDPNQEIKITYDDTLLKRHYDLTFMHVSFKNGQKGFRLINVEDCRYMDYRIVTTNTAYIALSDKPVRLGEIDVKGTDEAAVVRKEKAEAKAIERQHADGARFLKLHLRAFSSIVVTSECLSLMFDQQEGDFSVKQNGVRRRSSEYIANNERLVLTPDQETTLQREYEHGVFTITFSPVSFKNRLKGFRVTAIGRAHGSRVEVPGYTGYIALSDRPVLVGEKDVVSLREGRDTKDPL